MSKYTLISHRLCPYVQRVAITLKEKRIPFELVYIDLEDKPTWFVAISPLGKVPLLKIEQQDHVEVLFESTVILEYLEDMGMGRSMHPGDPIKRARHRAWMEFGSALLGDIWALETSTDEPAHLGALQRIDAKFVALEKALVHQPFFSEDDFSFVDAVFAPVFRYFDVFDNHLGTSPVAAFPKVSNWRRQLAQRPSVREAAPDNYNGLLEIFLRERDAWLVSSSRPKR